VSARGSTHRDIWPGHNGNVAAVGKKPVTPFPRPLRSSFDPQQEHVIATVAERLIELCEIPIVDHLHHVDRHFANGCDGHHATLDALDSDVDLRADHQDPRGLSS
jgi:hypothetical protein